MKTGSIFISGTCEHGCIFCEGSQINERDIENMEREAINNLNYHAETGTEVIEISGNDPGEYAKIVDLVKTIKDMGFTEIGLTTNGVRASILINELEDAGLNQLVFPLYGHTKEISSLTVKGHPQLEHVSKILQTSSNLRLVVKVGITKFNYKYIREMIDFIMQSRNVENNVSVELNRILPSGEFKDFFINLEELRPYVMDAYNYVFKLSAKEDAPNFVFDLENCLIDHFDPLFHINVAPEVGNQDYNNNYKTEQPSVPAYRIRDAQSGCLSCASYKNNCGGMLRIEHKNFGDLTRPIKVTS